MSEEIQQVPKWLKELEEKREKRLKSRLGHEAGAGSPCLTCGEKCPGLDLHFWRKTCKNCRCGKENHDVNDDDVYGWAQFQLLGSKPLKSTKIVLPGKKEEVELEWAPKGQSDAVESYLKELPPNMLPIKGSQAAQDRKQLLHKQIPIHDIDPSLCDGLTDAEVAKMSDYITHIKQNSVGMGHIMKLRDINRGTVHSAAEAHVVKNAVSKQFTNSEGVTLPETCHALLLKSGKNLPKQFNRLSVEDIGEYEQQATKVGGIRDVNYPIYQSGERGAPRSDKSMRNFIKTELTEEFPKNSVTNTVNYQNPRVTNIKNVNYSVTGNNRDIANEARNNNDGDFNGIGRIPGKLPSHFPQSAPRIEEEHRTGVDNSEVSTIYRDTNTNIIPQFENISNEGERSCEFDSSKGMLPHYAPHSHKLFTNSQNPRPIGNIRDLAYSTYDPGHFSKMGTQKAESYCPQMLNISENEQIPTRVNVGGIYDVEYPVLFLEEESSPESPHKCVNESRKSLKRLSDCHRCKIQFEEDSIIIGIERSSTLWHADCFRCAGCNYNLADLVYFYDKSSDNIYCGRDYAKIRGIPRCQACDELIFVKEYCLAENSTFHVKHFCCYECDIPLAGCNYVMEDSQPLCLKCYEKVAAAKCKTCLQAIKPDEQGARIGSVHYHATATCFSCKMCHTSLLGRKVLLKKECLYCCSECFRNDTDL